MHDLTTITRGWHVARTRPHRRGRSRDAHRLAELVQAWGFQTDEAADGEEAMQKVTTFRPAIIVSDLVMPRMGGLELLRALQGSAVRPHVHPADRAGDGRERGRGDQGRRLRLPEQAGRSAAAADPAAEGGRAAGDAARGQAPAAPAARAGQLRPHHRQQPRHPRRLPRHRAGGADQRVGADLGRVGHRQGAGRADDPRAEPARVVPVRRDQLRRDSRDAARERDLRPRERARSPARTIAAPASSSWRIAARCSSTRSPRCSRRRRSSCCACCRSGPSAASAGARSSRSTCASSPRPT